MRFLQRLKAPALFACILLTFLVPVVAEAETMRQGIDCGCNTTGDYRSPASPRRPVAGKAPVVYLVSDTEGQSAQNNPKYRLTVSTTDSTVSLYVRKAGDNVQVMSAVGLPRASTGWGFSPDEHRFVYHYIDISGSHHVRLHNLEGSQPGTAVWSPEGSAGWGTTVLFSPRGQYLLYADLRSNTTLRLRLGDSKTGSVAHTHEFSFVLLPEGEELDPEDEEEVEYPSVTWGFSPDRDDNSFAYAWAKTNSLVERRVIYLPTGSVVHNSEVAGSSLQIHFSPAGIFLFFATLAGNNHVFLNIMDAATGQAVYSDDFTFNVPAAGTRRFGVAAWGFSPDNQDAGFVYAWVTGQNQIYWTLANLEAGTSVYGESMHANAYWHFSRCADVLGVVSQTGSGCKLRLFLTYNGDKIQEAERDFVTVPGSMSLRSTSDSHIARVNGVDQTPALIENKAGKACSEPDTQPPTWPDGSQLSFSEISETSITVHWPEAQDNVGVTAYRVRRNATSVTVSGSTRSHTFSGLTADTTYTFQVEASDAADNWGVALTADQATNPLPPPPPPDWPADAELSVQACTGGRLHFTWTTAVGDVAGYRLYQGENLLDEVDGNTLSHTVIGEALELDRWISFGVEAGNPEGSWSEDGPTDRIWLLRTPGPCWPEDAHLGVRDIGPSSVTLQWPKATEADEVLRYEFFRGYTFMGTVAPAQASPEGHYTTVIDGLWWDTDYSFRVVAFDHEENPSEFLVSETVRTPAKDKDEPPVWPAGSSLTVSDIGTTALTLTWTAATDPERVAAYRIFLGDTRIATVSGQTLSHRIDGLRPARAYVFCVEAGDAWENWTEDGPTAPATMVDGPVEPEIPTVGAELVADFHVGEMFWWEGWKVLAEPAVSGDGNHVAFVSLAEGLIPGAETHGHRQVYVFDRTTGEVELVSRTAGGEAGDGPSYAPAVSADGRYVAFVSNAVNLDSRVFEKDFPADSDIFVHDRVTGETALVSIDLFGRTARGSSGAVLAGPGLSADGRSVVFTSYHLTPGVSAGGVFVHDRATGRTSPAGVSPAGLSLGEYVDRAVISADGRYVAFRAGPIYVVDRWSGRVVQAAPEAQYTTWQPIALSADGSIVVYEQTAAEDSYMNENDLFVHDLQTGETERVSFAHTTTHWFVESTPPPAVSGDGRFISFLSWDHTLAACASRWDPSLFLFDRWEKSFEVIEGGEHHVGLFPAVSGDGQVLVYQNVTWEDNNERSVQVYSYQRGTTDIRPPCWQNYSLETTGIGADYVGLQWEPAADNVGVTVYRIYVDDFILVELPAAETSYTVGGLDRDREYSFSVEAGDGAGNWSPFRISVTARTLDYLTGDVNFDGLVDLADAMLLLQYAAGLRDLTDPQKMAGNVTRHESPDEVGIADALAIIQILVETGSGEP